MSIDQDKAKLSLAARLKEARKMAGLSQSHVAEILDLHRPAISEIEAGNRRVNAEELSRLAKLYEVNISWLVGDAPEQIESSDPKIQLAARELSKLNPKDLDRLMRILAAMRQGDEPGEI